MTLIPEDRKLDMLYEKPVEDLTDEEIKKLIPHELGKWHKQNMSPLQVGHDIFAMDCQLLTVMDFLVEKKIATREELDVIYRRKFFSKLKEIREEAISQALRNEITKGVQIAVPKDLKII